MAAPKKRAAILHIEGVPNPNAMKFVLENGVLTDTPYEFASLADTMNSPLAQKLMMFRYIERVMLNRNYVTVLKTAKNSPEWQEIMTDIKSMIQTHLEQDEAILLMGVKENEHTKSDDPVAELVIDLLNKVVRPAAQEDGGDILFDSYDNGVLTIRMHGACHECPYIMQTIKGGVEPAVRSVVPEVKEVRPRLV
ncbi:MAG: NifU family protein [Bacteroidia bacterium]